LRRVLVDSGFLVALGRRADRKHAAAVAYLGSSDEQLITVGAVVVAACFFLNARAKRALLRWIAEGGIQVAEVPASNFDDLGDIIERYASRDIDLADAALVWLADQTGLRRILTLDTVDFSIFRLKGGKGFDLVDWA
jgi:predicted nucleic acid-binding protein